MSFMFESADRPGIIAIIRDIKHNIREYTKHLRHSEGTYTPPFPLVTLTCVTAREKREKKRKKERKGQQGPGREGNN